MSDIMSFSPLWGEWYIRELIGKGTFGAVYRAEKTEYGNTYISAVKHISIPDDNVSADTLISEGLVPDEKSVPLYYDTVRDKIIAEINFCYALRGNTNIVSYEDHCIIPKATGVGYDIFIRMEHLTALPKYMREHYFDQNNVIQLGIDICAALEVLDKHQIIHRDIKPANIFVNSVGVYKLGDFGESKVLSNTNASMTVRGTYTYMSPEISRGSSADIRADIYSLGIVMYRLLNGNKAPFVPLDNNAAADAAVIEAANVRRFRGDAMPLPKYCRSQVLADVIMKACAFSPEDRWTKPTQMRKALEKLQETAKPDGNTAGTAQTSGGAENKPDTAPEKPPKSRKKLWIFTAVLAALAVAGSVGAAVLLNRHTTADSQASHVPSEQESSAVLSDIPPESSLVSEKMSAGSVVLQSLVLHKNPVKTTYYVGEELDTAGLTIEALYSDGTKKNVPLPECTMTGFDSGTAGKKTVTVAYSGKTVSFEVQIEEAEPAGVLSGSCGKNVSYLLDRDGVLTISGQGAMEDYALGYVLLDNNTVDVQCTHPWIEYAGEIRRVVIGEGITHIGKYAFYDQKNMTEITIADSVTDLGDSCFRGCQKLHTLNLPAAAVTLGEDFLLNCSGLQAISVDEHNTKYASENGILYTHDKTELLKCPEAKEGSVGVHTGTVTIGEWSFDKCTKVTEIILPTSVTTIGSFAFSGCTSVESMFLLPNVERIEKSAFRYWQNTQELRFIEISAPKSGWDNRWNMECQARLIWNSEQYAMG